jgi:MFS transporter, DHA2 family, multidrug resistance protein
MTTRLSHAGFSAHDAHRQALGRLYGMLQRQASALSYVEVYWLLAVIAAVMFLGSFLLKRNQPGEGGHVAVH